MMKGIDETEALSLLESGVPEAYEILSRANGVRLEKRGLTVQLCGIVNAKSGHCTENCRFCAQSAHNDAQIDCYPMIDGEEMLSAARKAKSGKISRFSIVTSGLAVGAEEEIEKVVRGIEGITCEPELLACASLGNVTKEVLIRLKAAGLDRYHCNLEASESFFPEICTTRDWGESVETIRNAKEIGLTVCCGGIVGLGETVAQRVELLSAIRSLDVDSVPLNFLHPVPGTPLEDNRHLTPLDALKVVAVARLMMPDKEIRVCGGREYNLRDLQSWLLVSGVDGLMVGGYLTTSGRNVEDDLQMIADAGLTVECFQSE
jgi:biotin synthase